MPRSHICASQRTERQAVCSHGRFMIKKHVFSPMGSLRQASQVLKDPKAWSHRRAKYRADLESCCSCWSIILNITEGRDAAARTPTSVCVSARLHVCTHLHACIYVSVCIFSYMYTYIRTMHTCIYADVVLCAFSKLKRASTQSKQMTKSSIHWLLSKFQISTHTYSSHLESPCAELYVQVSSCYSTCRAICSDNESKALLYARKADIVGFITPQSKFMPSQMT
jgi:hypothetical protein